MNTITPKGVMLIVIPWVIWILGIIAATVIYQSIEGALAKDLFFFTVILVAAISIKGHTNLI